MTSISVKTPYYSPWFSARIWIFYFCNKKKRVPSERASQEEQNGANLSFVASKKLTKNALDLGIDKISWNRRDISLTHSLTDNMERCKLMPKPLPRLELTKAGVLMEINRLTGAYISVRGVYLPSGQTSTSG